MKKLYIFALVATLFAACVTDETQDVAVELAPETLTVSFEEAESRIQLDEAGKTVWTKGDEVSVFYLSNANQKWQYQGETGERTGNLKRVENATATHELTKVVVVYPYNSNYYINPESYNIKAQLPATQTYLANSYGVGGNIMISQGEYNQFSLKSACGWLKLQLTGNGEKVKSIKLKGNNGEQVAGEIYINSATAVATLAAEMGGADDSENTAGGNLVFDDTILTEVTLDCGEGVELGTEPTAFYIGLPPQTFAQGLTIEIEDTNALKMIKSTDKEVVISRNAIQPMAAFGLINDKPSVPNNNQIFYTATYTAYIYSNEVFDAKIVSNEWDSEIGEGIITFDKEISYIGEDAFSDCASLTSITLPNSITNVGERAFKDCYSLKEFKGKFASDNGATLIANNILVAYASKAELVEYIVPENVTRIGECAFRECEELEKIVIADSVESIGEGAFSSSSSIKLFEGKFAIDSGCALVVDNVFIAYAMDADLTQYSIPDGITKIGWYAFDNSTKLKEVTIPDSVTAVGDVAFAFCYNLKSVYCKPTTPPTAIFDNDGYGWEAFDYNFGETHIYVPHTSVEAYKTAEGWSKYADYIIGYDFEKGEVVLPEPKPAANEIWYTATEKVTPYYSDGFDAKIVSNEWDESTGKGVITFDGNVTLFGHAFQDCTSLTSITIPDSVIALGSTFYNCTSLTSITIPDSIGSIEQGAFEGCTSLTSVYYKGDLSAWCKIFFVDWNSHPLCYGAKLYINGVETTDIITIPSDITEIKQYTFYNCTSLTSVTIPDSVTSIGNYAFGRCTSLTSVTIPDSVPSIESYAFSGCSSLKAFYGKFASADNRCLIVDGTLKLFAPAGLTEYTIPDSVTEIGEWVFNSCTSLTSVTIGNSVTSIGDYTFYNCKSLTSITIPDSVTSIGDWAFTGCSSLKEVYCKPTTPPTGGVDMFSGNASGRKIYVPTASVEAYKSASGWWSYYADAIEGFGDNMPDFIYKGTNYGQGVKIDDTIWAPVDLYDNSREFPRHYIHQSSSGYYCDCPEGWRAPTKAEMNALIQNHSEWDRGYYFSGSQPYSKDVPSIFLGANGLCNLKTVYYTGEKGYYWTTEQVGAYGGTALLFTASNVYYEGINAFEYYCSVRCVKNK